MMHVFARKKWLVNLAIAFASLNSSVSIAAAGFTQIVLPFKSEKQFTYEWQKSDNTLVLQFPSTAPSELEALNNYDERMVRRLLVKDLGPAGTEVRLVLRDRNVRALVSSFKDPFRVTVDLFEKNYTQRRDPTTGLPLIEDESAPAPIAAKPNSGDNRKLKIQDTTEQYIPPTKAPEETVESPGKRRLMQALPEEINSPNALKAALAKIEPGVGKGWVTYPPYIYRAQLAPFEGREAPEKEITPWQTKAVTNSSAMADYAGKLYDFGHEARALMAYQQVLLKEPGVFEKDPVHLWKFAECHLGQGNFQLAEGYYTSLIDKHSSHALARYAQLRKLDVAAIKSVQRNDNKALAGLASKMEAINIRGNAELTAQTQIRKAWWTDPNASQDRKGAIPKVTEEIQRSLISLIPNVESQRTAFLAASLAASRMVQADTPWESSYAEFLANYFERFKGPSADSIRDDLSNAAKNRLTAEIKSAYGNAKYLDLVKMFESLPSSMKSVRKTPEVAWMVGESYRQVGQSETAIPFYQTATNVPIGIDRFKAQFWLNNLAGNSAESLRAARGNQEKIHNYDAASRRADDDMQATWDKLKSDEKTQILTGMGDAIESSVASDLKARTPAKILLEKWTSTLTVNPPKMTATNGTNPTDPVGNFSPSAGTVHVLDDLGKKFAELGMQPEKRKALELMRFIQPSAIEQDKTAQKIWSDQLLNLAEEHRKANEFLEAGELYSLVGDGAVSSENRAESYYKGGLLLYRAGKKQDAIKALEKAKSDANNLFYSKLATERLDQLQAH